MTKSPFSPIRSRLIGRWSSALALSVWTSLAVPLSASETPVLNPRVMEMMKTNVLGSIEVRIHFVEKWELPRAEKAQVFLAMLSTAPEDDQRKLAHAAVAQVTDANYPLVRSHLLDGTLSKIVLSVFMTDILKRDYGLKLPALLSLAQIASHPMQVEARELLRGYLKRDHGTNWSQWKEAIDLWLKEKGQSVAAAN